MLHLGGQQVAELAKILFGSLLLLRRFLNRPRLFESQAR